MVDQNDDVEEVPEDIEALQNFHRELKADLKRLRERKQSQVALARSNQINTGDVVADLYDELTSMQTQLAELCTLTATSADAAAQYANAIADHVGFGDDEEEEEEGEEGEEGDEEGEEDEGGSFLTKEDADMLSSAIIRAGAAIVDAKEGKQVDWDDVLKELEIARELVAVVVEKPEPVEH